MATSQDHMKEQEVRAENIEKIIAIIKKAPIDRRTKEFYEIKRTELVNLWQTFERIENTIRNDASLSGQDPYIIMDLYRSTGERYSSIIDYIDTQIKNLNSLKTKPVPTIREKTPDNQISETSNKQHEPVEELVQGLARRMTARMTALYRLLHGLESQETDQPKQFYQLKLETITRLWTQIQNLYDDLWQQTEDPSKLGIQQQNYDDLDDLVQYTLVKLEVSADKLDENVTCTPRVRSDLTVHSSLPLPKVTIPQFNGDCLKWHQFYELFLEMVDKQPLPNVQKMWYLKTNLSGEALKLISHLALTEDNYKTAWTLLQERYNNKRVLVATLVEKILNQPKGTLSTASIKTLHDTTKECMLALNNLNIDTSSWDAILIQIMMKKLDHTLYIRFMQSLSKPKEVTTIKELFEFLEIQFEAMESIGQKSVANHGSSRVVSSIASAEGRNACKLCKIDYHRIYQCKKFIKMTEPERLNWVQHQKLCVNCFMPDHSAKTCTFGNCKKCNNKHNTLLHLSNKPQSKLSPANKMSPTRHGTPTSNAVAVSSAAVEDQKHVLLATARVIIEAPNGISDEFRAVLDSGSQVNIVTERLIKILSLSTRNAALAINGVGRTQKKAYHRTNMKLISKSHGFSTNLEAFVLPTIIPAQPNHNIDISDWKIPQDIQLADSKFNMPGKIDILLGAEFYFSLIQPGTIRLTSDHPILQNTLLGWIVGGLIKQPTIFHQPATLTCAILDGEDTLQEAIQHLWKLDEVETNEKIMSPAESLCESHFNQHVQIDLSGRFIVNLPFKENPAALGHSHHMAYNRFISLEQRLHKNPEIRSQYIQFMREYENLGHMQKVNMDNISNPKYFIPHHCVLKPDSTSTKLRVVFDASAKSSTGYSLNDLMHTGPTIQSDLFSILLRFRMPRFVFTTDIEKMYRQILITPDNYQYQLIIWRENSSSPINYYKLNTVTYGTRAAPYLATKCLQRIAEENINRYPFGARMLKENFYMDDGLGGSDSLHTAVETQRELLFILKKHGFNLRKWCSNNPRLLKDIPHSDREVNLDFDNNIGKTIKTLGLFWMPQTDHFCIKVKTNNLQVVSKRTVTSELARIFDPLGLLCPVVVKAKIFIQQLWQLTLDWDEPLPQKYCATWETFRRDLECLNDFKIPRHMFYGEIPTKTQLHVFADASERAFGAVAYIRSTRRDGGVIVRLLCAKSRVAPIKQQTLPRLELCAAVTAAQLAHRIRVDLNLKNQPMFLWTDSEIVLHWINSQSSSYKTFVANRVSTVQTLTLPEQWRHVKSKDNPADILSRGLQPTELSKNGLWLHGPVFLHGKEELWPRKFSPQNSISNNIEMKRVVTVAAVTTDTNFIYKIPHKNSFRTLQRILGYVRRFTRNSRMPNTHRPKNTLLTPKELDDSLLLIVQAIQAEDFKEEIKQLKEKKEISNHSSISSLSPFLDERGIIRVGGRLKYSNLQPDAKHPIVLPYNDPLVKLVFIMMHDESKHCGPQALLNTIRQRFWPIKGKITARSVIQKCIRCTKARPQLYQQLMGNLPEHRVVPARPFINSGVDYCGPFWIHYKVRGKQPTKAYVAVFCCFATKAVHLELVSNLSTEAFVGALKRFIARRGYCQNIYCDNATNFVGAKNSLKELSENIHSDKAQNAINLASSSKGIHFHFIPPRAPHFGGLWEAAVKSAKHLLIRSVSAASLTHEELETVIIEIEAILNSRPLTPLSNDPNSLEALTPGHFLIGEALTSQVDSRAEPLKSSSLSHWKLISYIKQQFWKRWSAEYLNELQQRHKWKRKNNNLKKGDMVIIKEDNVPTMKWPLGRVINVFTGDDGMVRVVEVKTATGIFRRPIHRLAPLFQEDKTKYPAEEKPKLEEARSIEEEEIISPKRFKPTVNSIALTMLITILLIPTILCNNLRITTFHKNPGLYFEGIGTAKLNTAEWKLMVYYDLTPFSSELDSLSLGVQTLQQQCSLIQRHSICDLLVTNLRQIKNELLQEEDVIGNRRSKRSPFNIVGNIAHSLFGVLDSEYAEEMSKTINTAKMKEDHIIRLLKNQTSIIDSTINIIKQDETSMRQKIKELMRMIDQNKNELVKESSQTSNVQLVGLLSTQLTLTAINLQKIEAEIINVLTDAHNGKIGPLLLSPQQLKTEMAVIKTHLPTSYTLPVSEDSLMELYKIMNAKGAVTKKEVIFEVKIPLVNQQSFEIFNVVPVPTVKNNTLIVIKPDILYFATDAHRDEYILFTTDDLANCIKARDNEFICKNKQSKFKRNSDINPCEINIFNGRSTNDCILKRIAEPAVWTQLNQPNKWIFATTTDIESSMVCGIETTQFIIKNTGIMEIGSNCVLKNDFVTIQGHFGLSNTVNTSYVKLQPITSISKPQEIERIFTNNATRQYNIHLDKLNNLQKQLNEATLEHLPQLINSNSQHHHIVSYTALVLCLIILLGLFSWKIYKKQAYSTTPKPALRAKPATIELHHVESSDIQRGGEC